MEWQLPRSVCIRAEMRGPPCWGFNTSAKGLPSSHRQTLLGEQSQEQLNPLQVPSALHPVGRKHLPKETEALGERPWITFLLLCQLWPLDPPVSLGTGLGYNEGKSMGPCEVGMGMRSGWPDGPSKLYTSWNCDLGPVMAILRLQSSSVNSENNNSFLVQL